MQIGVEGNQAVRFKAYSFPVAQTNDRDVHRFRPVEAPDSQPIVGA